MKNLFSEEHNNKIINSSSDKVRFTGFIKPDAETSQKRNINLGIRIDK